MFPQFVPTFQGDIPLVGVGASDKGRLVIMLGVSLQYRTADNQESEQRFVLALEKEQAEELCRSTTRALRELQLYEDSPPEQCN
jgi:hypothetical protein